MVRIDVVRAAVALSAAFLAGLAAAADPASRCVALDNAGAQRCTLPDGSREEFRLDREGRRDGIARAFDPAGTLRSELTLESGTPVGPQRLYDEAGRLQRLSFVTGSRVQVLLAFWPDGSLSELRCAPVSLLPQDREPCGHGGPARDVSLYKAPGKPGTTVRYRDGVLVWLAVLNEAGQRVRSEAFVQQPGQPDKRIKRVYYPGGALRSETELIERPASAYEGREGVGREWAESGQLTQEVVWARGREQRVRQWYLNGQLKLDQRITRSGRHEERLTQSYWDNGKPAAVNRERDGRLSGLQRYFSEAGVKRREDQHGERGELLRRKEFDERGRVTLDERFDGDPTRRS